MKRPEPLVIRKTGRGCLVFLHGAGGNHSVWFPLSRMDWPLDVVPLDLPGHGRLRDHSPLLSPEEAFSWLEGVLRDLPEPRVVVGHSLGGALALGAALHIRLAGVAAVASALRFPERTSPGPPNIACRRLFHRPDFRRRCEEHFARFLDPRMVEADLRLASQLDLRPVAPRVTPPVLLLWARHDALLPYSLALEARNLLPDARLEEIPGGHMVVLEHPDRVADAIRAFLEEVL